MRRYPESAFSALLLLSLAFLYFLRHVPSWFSSQGIAPNDWGFNLFYLEAFRKSIVEYGELPLWNPWSRGGYPFYANPGIKSWSPDTLLAIFFGTITGARLAIILHYFVGLTGWLYLTLAVLRWNPWISIFCGSFFLFQSFVPLHLYAGHANFSALYYLPWCLAFFVSCYRARDSRRRLTSGFLCAFSLELMLYSAAFYFIVHALVAATGWCIIQTVLQRRLNAVRSLFLVVVIFMVLSLHASLPVVTQYRGSGFFQWVHEEALAPSRWLQIFTSPTGDPEVRNWDTQKLLWWEYGNYIGFTLFFVSAPLLLWIRRRHLPLIAGGIVLPLCFLGGDWSDFAPYRLAVDFDIPIFRNLRAHGRWSIVLLFAWCLLAGDLLHACRSSLTKHSRSLRVAFSFVLAFLFLYSFYDLQIHNSRFLARLFPEAKAPLSPERGNPLRTIHSASTPGIGSCYHALRVNLACADAYEMLLFPERVRADSYPDYRGEFYFIDSDFSIQPVEWSPNLVRFELKESRRQRIVLNQNYNTSWLARGANVVDHQGLLALEILPGIYTIDLEFRPVLYLSLLSISALLHLVLLAWFMWRWPGAPLERARAITRVRRR